MADTFNLVSGRSPLLISVPHAGVEVPASIAERFSAEASLLPDTDWYVDRLYDFAEHLGAGVISALYSRYVIDLNRPPDDAALYQSKTPGLVPLQTFSGEAIYAATPPGVTETQERLDRYWRPYHEAVRTELDRIRTIYGYAILFDAHSICSRVPGLFDGQLPDLNLGSYDGASAAFGLVESAMGIFKKQNSFSFVLDGRFKGGYITRRYGRPDLNIHALQLEMSQAVYMNENPPEYNDERAQSIQGLLRQLISGILEWRPEHE